MFTIMKKIVSGFVCHFLYHVKYDNIEILEKYERCIICPSHSNVFDPCFIFTKTESLYIMAKSEIFKNKIIGKILYHYHVFPIKREKNDIKGVKIVLELFKQNEKIKLLMFPEGGILKNNDTIKKVKNGAVYLASTLEVPLIPVYITRCPKLFSKVIVKIGEPMLIEKEVLDNKELMKIKSKQLIDTIYDMKK